MKSEGSLGILINLVQMGEVSKFIKFQNPKSKSQNSGLASWNFWNFEFEI
jgi:hypothetical protein